MEKDFDLVSQKLQNGDIVDAEIISENPDGNTYMRFVDKQGNTYESLVYHDKTLNKIFAPLRGKYLETVDIRPASGNIEPFQLYPIDFKDYETTKLNNIFPKSRDVFEKLRLISGAMWRSGSTFRDLQALSLAFIQGFLLYSPSHFGPLDLESNIILERLNAMNRLDMITTDSEPYEEYLHYKTKVPVKQRPYVNFVYWNDKTIKLIQMLLQRKPSVVIHTLKFLDGAQTVYGTDKPLPIHNDRLPASQEFKNGRWYEDYHTSIPIKADDETYNYLLREFGYNFEDLLQHNLTHITIIDMNFDNSVFDELVKIGKELL
jgi:hypothetical protein